MKPQALISAIEELAAQLDIEMRKVPLGGSGGGLCVLKGHRVLFVDTSADRLTQIACSLSALAQLPEINTVYMGPNLREQLMRAAPRRG